MAEMVKEENLAGGPQGPRGPQGHAGPQGPQGPQGPPGLAASNIGGVIYTRWGRTTCPNGVQLVYAGRIGGSRYRTTGGGANYLCMPNTPEYGRYTPGVQGWSQVFGAEFEPSSYTSNPGPFGGLHEENAPCAICEVTAREKLLMIPAKLTCPNSWTREYNGYLMSTYHSGGHYRTMFICVDGNPDRVPGQVADTDPAVLYHTEANCNGMPCGPYDPQKELTCVVCTK